MDFNSKKKLQKDVSKALKNGKLHKAARNLLVTTIAAGSALGGLAFVSNVNPSANTVVVAAKKAVKKAKAAEVKRSSAVYNKKGKKVAGHFKKGKTIKVYGTKTIKGKKYYSLGHGKYIAAKNVKLAKTVTLKKTSYIFNSKGKRVGEKTFNKNKKIKVYGTKTIKGKKYYSIGNGKYVLAANTTSGAVSTPTSNGSKGSNSSNSSNGSNGSNNSTGTNTPSGNTAPGGSNTNTQDGVYFVRTVSDDNTPITSDTIDMGSKGSIDSLVALIKSEYAPKIDVEGATVAWDEASLESDIKASLKASNVTVDDKGYFEAPAKAFDIKLKATASNGKVATLTITVNVPKSDSNTNNTQDGVYFVRTVSDDNTPITSDSIDMGSKGSIDSLVALIKSEYAPKIDVEGATVAWDEASLESDIKASLKASNVTVDDKGYFEAPAKAFDIKLKATASNGKVATLTITVNVPKSDSNDSEGSSSESQTAGDITVKFVTTDGTTDTPVLDMDNVTIPGAGHKVGDAVGEKFLDAFIQAEGRSVYKLATGTDLHGKTQGLTGDSKFTKAGQTVTVYLTKQDAKKITVKFVNPDGSPVAGLNSVNLMPTANQKAGDIVDLKTDAAIISALGSNYRLAEDNEITDTTNSYKKQPKVEFKGKEQTITVYVVKAQ
ncbi:SLAP domain-containing protein [Lactobacillus sp. ESL0785]|uniref:SLAP domain-containing protein n=1 Tax=Lactobacillus sp. ESL0785 TaxID=2983232 RepID=UPI0023F70CFA|nr:SLAP domain-containing protein [Lactobacillus sp. ESL0785]WEV70755.1 SLAP domain-containing protein [Lactobacillus sp. ESL0785]